MRTIVKIFSVLAFGSLSLDQAFGATVLYNCKPIEVGGVPGTRIHVLCDKGYTNNSALIYFSMPARTNDEIQRANLAVSVGMLALSTDKTVGLRFDDVDTSGTEFGCASLNCRTLSGIFVVK